MLLYIIQMSVMSDQLKALKRKTWDPAEKEGFLSLQDYNINSSLGLQPAGLFLMFHICQPQQSYGPVSQSKSFPLPLLPSLPLSPLCCFSGEPNTGFVTRVLLKEEYLKNAFFEFVLGISLLVPWSDLI